jgi:hypothetical protein
MTDSDEAWAPWYSNIKGWLVLLAITVAFFVGRRIPLAGIDREILAQFPAGSVASIFMLDVAVLLAIRLGTMLFVPSGVPDKTVRVLHKLGLVLYLIISGVQGAAVAWALEQMMFGYGGVVSQPGWSFRIVTVITLGAAAALLWWMADRISATKLVNGALWLYTLSAMSSGVNMLTNPSLYWEPTITATLIAMMVFLPLAVTAIGLALFHLDWPKPVARQLVAFSPLDLLCWPFIGWNAAFIIRPSQQAFLISDDAFVAFELLAATCMAFFAFTWLYFKHERRGSPAWIVLAILALFPPLGTSAIWVLQNVQLALEPSPLAGTVQLELVLLPDEGIHPSEVQEAIERRLDAFGVEGEVSLDGDLVRARLKDVDPEAAIDTIGRPKRLTMHIEKSDLPFADMAEAKQWAVAQDGDWAIECQPDPPCTGFLLEPAVILPGDIAEASTAFNPNNNEPYVRLGFTLRGADRFCQVSGAHVNERLVIVIDGEAISAPVIREAICGGVASIEMGASLDPGHEAALLVGALNSASDATWTLEQTNTFQ